MDIFIYIIAIIGAVVGFSSTVYATLSIPIIIFYKIYRSIRYHISLYD